MLQVVVGALGTVPNATKESLEDRLDNDEEMLSKLFFKVLRLTDFGHVIVCLVNDQIA